MERKNEPIRILYLIGQLGVGGAERQLISLAKNIDRTQFDPIVCSLSTQSPLAKELSESDISITVLPEKMKPDLTRFWRVYQVVRKNQPALIHSYMFVANTWARTASMLTGIPVIVSERNAEIFKSKFKIYINRLLSRRASAMIANSYSGAELAVKRGEIASEKVAVIPNGIQASKFYVSTTMRKPIRNEFGISKEQKIVSIVGSLNHQKDHKVFFRAVEAVINFYPDLIVLCVGDGPLREDLGRLVMQLGLEENVIFTGKRNDIPAILGVTDVFVLSSLWEGCPNVVLEAMAASCPVVATKVGDVPKIIGHGKSGILVEPGDYHAIARGIKTLLGDSNLTKKMGKNGRERVVQQYPIEKMVSETEKIYHRVIDRENNE